MLPSDRTFLGQCRQATDGLGRSPSPEFVFRTGADTCALANKTPGVPGGFCLPARRYLLRCEIRTPERGFVPDHLLPACTGLETSHRTGASPVPFGVGARKDRPDQ